MGKHKHKDKETEAEEVKEEQQPSTPDDDSSKAKSSESKPYEELVALVNVISNPLASKKLTKKLYKVVKKAKKAKRLKRGVREVVKALRKDEKGVVVLAGDVSPIDVVSHIPVFCEDKEVPYCYVPSRRDLGSASLTKRPTSVVLVKSDKEYQELYQECHTAVDALPLPI